MALYAFRLGLVFLRKLSKLVGLDGVIGLMRQAGARLRSF